MTAKRKKDEILCAYVTYFYHAKLCLLKYYEVSKHKLQFLLSLIAEILFQNVIIIKAVINY